MVGSERIRCAGSQYRHEFCTDRGCILRRASRCRKDCQGRTGGDSRPALRDRNRDRISGPDDQPFLLSADLALREKRIAEFKTTIDACQQLGVDTIVTFTGSSFGMSFYGLPGVGDGHSSNRVADNLQIFAEVYGPMADYAEQRGVRIAFETAGRGGPEGNLAHSPELVVRDVRGGVVGCDRVELRSIAPGLAWHTQCAGRNSGVRAEDLPLRRQGHRDPAQSAGQAGDSRLGVVAVPIARPWRTRLEHDLPRWPTSDHAASL